MRGQLDIAAGSRHKTHRTTLGQLATWTTVPKKLRNIQLSAQQAIDIHMENRSRKTQGSLTLLGRAPHPWHRVRLLSAPRGGNEVHVSRRCQGPTLAGGPPSTVHKQQSAGANMSLGSGATLHDTCELSAAQLALALVRGR